nr:hypothetical protein [Tanacetum cinerariifolium]
MQGSGLTKQQKKETLFNQYEMFRANGNESIHDYFFRFYKLINDMKITTIEIPVHQRNTKFVNNLPSYWGKYVTIVKNSKDISTVSYVDLYTHLKSYEQHAMKTLSKYPQPITSSISQYVPPPPQNTPAPQQAPQLTNDAMLATMNQIINMLSEFQKQFPPTNNQLRASTNPTTQATIQDGQITTKSVQRRALGNTGNHVTTGSQGNKKGNQEYGSVVNAQGKLVTCYNCHGQGHMARQCRDKKRAKDSQWFKDKALLMEAKEKGAILDAEAEAFLADIEYTVPYVEPLAITTTTKVQTYDNHFFDNLNHQVSQEMHRGEQLDSDVDSVIGDHDNTIPYHQYQLNNEVESVPTDVSSVLPGGISVITILDDLRVYDSEDTLVQAEVSRTKMLEKMKNPLCKVSSKPVNYAKLNSLSNCVKEHSKNLELEAEILKMKQLLAEIEKQCPFIETEYQELEFKFQKYKECFENPQNDSLRDENVSIKKRYQDLYKSKAESNSNVSSGATVPEKPKVLAHGLYAMTPKNLPARSENVKRVENTSRNLNKRNRVDSSLSVKRIGFSSKSISIFKTCNECLVFGNHDKCSVKYLNSVNAENPKVKNDANVKQVWKATGKIFASVDSKWKPTGRKFTLGDTCPLTRFTKPKVVPLEKSRSVSISEPANNVTVTPRFFKKPLISYKRKDRKIKDISTGNPPNAETQGRQWEWIPTVRLAQFRKLCFS